MKISIKQIAVWILAALITTGMAGAATLETIWTQAPDDQLDFLRSDNTHRGGAYNAANNTVVVVSRATGAGVFILDGTDGSLLRSLDASSLFGGTFQVNMAGVSDDGIIYVGNLSTSAEFPQYKVYRYSTDEEFVPPDTVFDGDPGATADGGTSGQRWGDTMAVRGSGNDTQILIGSRAGTVAAILTTGDDGFSFSATEIQISGINAGDIGLGVAFGTENTFWGTAAGRPIYQIEFDLESGTGTVIRSIEGDGIPAGFTNIAISPDGQYMAVTDLNAHTVSLYDISDPLAAPVFQSAASLPTSNTNINGTGALDFGDGVLMALETNNGVALFEIVEPTEAIAPEIVSGPTGVSVFEGSEIRLSVVATGTTPLAYQWFKNGEPVEGGTSSTLVLSDTTAAMSGDYSVTVSNVAGEASTDPVTVTIRQPVDPNLLQELWSLAPNERTYLGTANTERGMAYNPAENHIILISRNGGVSVNVLDADTGDHLHEMNSDPGLVFGGTFPVSMVAAGDDGAIYAANLTLDGTTSSFIIYSWENDSPDSVPYNSYFGDPGFGAVERWGDTLDARGAGTDTQIIASARSGNSVAIFTTTDGLNFDSTLISGVSGGLGVTFGEGNTFWTTSQGQSLDLYEFDLESATATLVASFDGTVFPSGISPIDAFPQGGFLAGIDLGAGGLLKLFSYQSPESDPLLLLEKPFATSNTNANGVGSVAFGNDPRRLYALNTNNGLVAFDLGEFDPQAVPTTITGIALDQDNNAVVTLSGSPGAEVTIEFSGNLVNWGTPVTVTLDQSGAGSLIISSTEQEARFARIAIE